MPGTRHDTAHRELAPRRRDLFERFFDDRLNFFRLPPFMWPEVVEGVRLEEYREDKTLVLRAELAGVNPESDIDISLTDHVLRIEAERHEEEKTEGRDYVRRGIRYGSFVREIPLPPGVTESDVKATYNNGILEVRVPMPEGRSAVKVPVVRQ